jgi:hypothetical protein
MRAAVASADSTAMYVFHTACGADGSSGPPIAATVSPWSRAMKYRLGASAGITSSNSQPNRPE